MPFGLDFDLGGPGDHTYTAAEDETPRTIAGKLGINTKILLELNREQYEGLTQNSRLREGTVLTVPFDGTDTNLIENDKKTRAVSREELSQLLMQLKKLDSHNYFASPVTEEDAPHYARVIAKPMDFSTIESNVKNGKYDTVGMLEGDFKLMLRNAIVYNETGSEVGIMAKYLLSHGESLIAKCRKMLADGKNPNETLDEEYEGTRDKPNTLKFLFRGGRESALKRLGESTREPMGSIAPYLPTEISAYGVTPVTDLHYSPLLSFGPKYSSYRANLDAGKESSDAYGPQDSTSNQTSINNVLEFDYREHAASILSISRRIDCSQEELNEQHAAVSSFSEDDFQSIRNMKRKKTNADLQERVSKKIGIVNNTKINKPIRESSNLLEQLYHLREKRLDGFDPFNMSDLERDTAESLIKNLTSCVKEMNPKDMVEPSFVQNAVESFLMLFFFVSSSFEKVGIENSDPVILIEPRKTASRMRIEKCNRDKFPEPGQIIHCQNCKKDGPSWRSMDKNEKDLMCYACGIYYTYSGHLRPVLQIKHIDKGKVV
eukprot:m.124671 g.124671  ORF g.124671 m.124671 type:complete len:546 (+) comp14478_c0_seq3:400-2037(+)